MVTLTPIYPVARPRSYGIGMQATPKAGMSPKASVYLNASSVNYTRPLFGKGGSRSDHDKIWDHIPPELQRYVTEHSMPKRREWLKHVTPAMMDRIVELSHLKDVDEICSKIPESTPIGSIGFGYGDQECRAVQALFNINGHQRVRMFGIDIAKEAADTAHEVAINEYGMNQKATGDFLAPFNVFNKWDRRQIQELNPRFTRVPKGTVGVMYLGSMLHFTEAENRELLRIAEDWLAPGGYLVITHWFRGYEPRGPKDSDRPTPGDTVRLAFTSPKEPLWFVNYEKLSDGMYCAVFKKSPVDNHISKIDPRLDPTSLWLQKFSNTQFDGICTQFREPVVGVLMTPKHSQAFYNFFQQLEKIDWEPNCAYKNYAKAAVFMEGAIERYLKDNPDFVKEVREYAAHTPDYVKFINSEVDKLTEKIKHTSRVRLSILERRAWYHKQAKEWDADYELADVNLIEKILTDQLKKVRLPERFEARRILMGALELAKKVSEKQNCSLAAFTRWVEPHKFPPNCQQLVWSDNPIELEAEMAKRKAALEQPSLSVASVEQPPLAVATASTQDYADPA